MDCHGQRNKRQTPRPAFQLINPTISLGVGWLLTPTVSANHLQPRHGRPSGPARQKLIFPLSLSLPGIGHGSSRRDPASIACGCRILVGHHTDAPPWRVGLTAMLL